MNINKGVSPKCIALQKQLYVAFVLNKTTCFENFYAMNNVFFVERFLPFTKILKHVCNDADFNFQRSSRICRSFCSQGGNLTTELCRHVEILLFQFHLDNTGKCNVVLFIKVHVNL